jgi:hypothetical protein
MNNPMIEGMETPDTLNRQVQKMFSDMVRINIGESVP